jgi:hypothetical protein
MGVRHDIPTSLDGARSTLKGKTRRNIGYQTALATTDNGVALEHWGTAIVEYLPDGWVEVTNDYGSVTTTARIRSALPSMWSIGSAGKSGRYIFHAGYRITPAIDGISVNDGTADAAVMFGGDVVLTWDDVATIKAAEDGARSARADKRAARLLREHPAVGDPSTHPGRYGRPYDCPRCTEESRLEREAHRAALSAEHDANGHPYGRCPWDCPKRGGY